MIHSQPIYSDQKQVRSRGGAMPRGVCYALVPGHYGQGGRHVSVVGGLPIFSRLLASRLTTIVPSLELAGGFGSRSLLGSGGALQSALHFQPQHQIIHYLTDAVHFLSRLSFVRLRSTQHGLDRKVWRYPIQIIRCPL